MNLTKELIEALNTRNRTKINECFNSIYDKYIDLLFYNAIRIVGSKDVAMKIANDSMLLIFKNMTSVEDLVEDLVYINNENAKKYIENKDQIDNDYNEILNILNIEDNVLDIYVNVYLYDRKLKAYLNYKGNNKKEGKLLLYNAISRCQEEKVKEAIKANLEYDSISSRIEMPRGSIFVREKKFLISSFIGYSICILCFIIAFVISTIPSIRSKVSQVFFYISACFLLLAILCTIISAGINKTTQNRK
ncbi:MAG: hypothetical protein ACI35W_07415 [Anaeroplasmataceae bacterium]